MVAWVRKAPPGEWAKRDEGGKGGRGVVERL